MIKQYAISGRVLDGERFVHPDEFSTKQVHDLVFVTLGEAKQCARVYHEQFGDAYAVWFRGKQVGVYDTRSYVSLDPDFR